MVSTQQFLSAATSFLHFCSTPEWTLHRPVFFFGISICSSRRSSTGYSGYSTLSWSSLFSYSSHLGVISDVYHPFLKPHLILGFFCPFLNVLPQVTLAWLTGSAVSCSGSILKPDDSGMRHTLVLSQRSHPTASTLPTYMVLHM